MSANRNADLQRKLGAIPAPAPPDGLAQKIKSEIPKNLRVEARKPSRATLRIAASILVASIGAYVMFRLLPHAGEPLPAAAPAAKTAPIARMQEEKPAVIALGSNAVKEKVERRGETADGRLQTADVRRQTSDVRRQTSDVRRQTLDVRRQTTDGRRQEIAQRETPAKVQMPEVAADEVAKTEAGENAPKALALAAPAAPPSAQGGVAARAAAVVEEPARLNVEATVSPFSGRTLLRVTTDNAPESKVVVEGAEKIGTDLYAINGEVTTIRLQFLQRGVKKSIERTIGRADILPWKDASPQMKDAVTRAENPQ